MPATIRTIFARPATWITFLGISLVLFSLIIFFPHRETFFALSKAGVSGSILFSFLGVMFSNSTVISLSGAVIISLLTGVYVPIFIAYVRTFGLNKSGISGIWGTIIGTLGIGCVACGSAILVPLLSALGLGGITKPVYDKKHQEFADKLQLLEIELSEHRNADYEYQTTVATLINVARRARTIFENCSEPMQKRAFLKFLLQNPYVKGKKLYFTIASPFNLVLDLADCPDLLRG